MDFGSMMSNLAIGAGQSMIAGVEQQQRQATLDDTRAQTQMRQMQAMAMKQEMENTKTAADDAKAGFATIQGGVKTAEDRLQGLMNGENIAIAKGDYAALPSLEAHIKSTQEVIKSKQADVKEKMLETAQTAGHAGEAYEQFPTLENAQAVQKAAAAAGVPAEQIPSATESGKILQLSKKLQMGASTVQENRVLSEKIANDKALREATAQKEKDTQAFRLEEQRRLAQYQGGMLSLEQSKVGLEGQRLKLAQTKAGADAPQNYGEVSSPEELAAFTAHVNKNSPKSTRVSQDEVKSVLTQIAPEFRAGLDSTTAIQKVGGAIQASKMADKIGNFISTHKIETGYMGELYKKFDSMGLDSGERVTGDALTSVTGNQELSKLVLDFANSYARSVRGGPNPVATVSELRAAMSTFGEKTMSGKSAARVFKDIGKHIKEQAEDTFFGGEPAITVKGHADENAPKPATAVSADVQAALDKYK